MGKANPEPMPVIRGSFALPLGLGAHGLMGTLAGVVEC